MKCYLVTGGCGFIGSNLVKFLLENGSEVIVLDDLSSGSPESIPADIPLICADVSEISKVSRAFKGGVDGCFHLAANPSVLASMEDYSGSHKTNLGGTISIFQVASQFKDKKGNSIPIVYASSCAVYGSSQDIPLVEESETLPLSGYGADKLCGEIHAGVLHRAQSIPSIGLRFFNVFGPGQRPKSRYSGVLSIFCQNLSTGNQVTIFGDGKQKRDFVFIGDVVEVLIKAMDAAHKGSFGIFNVCTGQGTSLLEVGQIIADISGTNFDPEFDAERLGDIRISIGNPDKCEQILNWKSSTDIKTGLRKTMEWLAEG